MLMLYQRAASADELPVKVSQTHLAYCGLPTGETASFWATGRVGELKCSLVLLEHYRGYLVAQNFRFQLVKI